MPLGADVSANMHELKEANKSKPKGKRRSQKQRVAIALSAARRAGGDVPPPPKKTGRGQDTPRQPLHPAGENPVLVIGVGNSRAHPGFASAQESIAKRQGISQDRAGAILAAGARNASKAAVKKNPRLKKVRGAGRGTPTSQ